MLFLDVHSKKPYPSCALSNFAAHPFVLDGVQVRSMEGLLQSLKVAPEMQREVCLLDGKSAKELGSACNWQENGAVFHWNGSHFSRFSRDYWKFLKRSYDAMVDQNKDFAIALRDTGHCILWHSAGKFRKNQTALTTLEFLRLLYRARRRARKRRRTNS
jgi:predicted NAD-dependent protein-ADP-ribosyltransferase YbiA (DUF1768 family)